MQPLIITATMQGVFSTNTPWSPSIDMVLAYFWLESRGLLQANPTPESAVDAKIPLAQSIYGCWSASSPQYTLEVQGHDNSTRRFAPELGYIDWGAKNQKVQTNGGPYKLGINKIPYFYAQRISWYVVGCAEEIESLLSNCHYLGSRRAGGFGAVANWTVRQIQEDKSCWDGDKLMRPLPVRLLPEQNLPKLNWGWRGLVREERELCYMPVGNIKEPEIDWFKATLEVGAKCKN